MLIAHPFVEALQGKTVSHVWSGHGSALFLEFGTLSEGPQTDRTPVPLTYGELTLMIEWSWRVERPRSIMAGSWSSDRLRQAALKHLIGGHVTEVNISARLPEISISLSNGLSVASFMTAEGQPSWAVIARVPRLGSLHVKRGALCIEPMSSYP